MPDHAAEPDDFDGSWKVALDRYFPQFQALLWPGVHARIDWTYPLETLDTELQQVVRDADVGRRHADKLCKVRMLGGAPVVVIVHVEVQGRPDADFALRMFQYRYRLMDRYGTEAIIVWPC